MIIIKELLRYTPIYVKQQNFRFGNYCEFYDYLVSSLGQAKVQSIDMTSKLLLLFRCFNLFFLFKKKNEVQEKLELNIVEIIKIIEYKKLNNKY